LIGRYQEEAIRARKVFWKEAGSAEEMDGPSGAESEGGREGIERDVAVRFEDLPDDVLLQILALLDLPELLSLRQLSPDIRYRVSLLKPAASIGMMVEYR
jgi:hypothetical protein